MSNINVLAMDELINKFAYKQNYKFIGYVNGVAYSIPNNIENDDFGGPIEAEGVLNISEDELVNLFYADFCCEVVNHPAFTIKPHNFVSEIAIYESYVGLGYLISFPFITSSFLQSYTFNGQKINPLKLGIKINDLSELENIQILLKDITELVKDFYKNENFDVILPQNILIQEGLSFDNLKITKKRFIIEKYDRAYRKAVKLFNKHNDFY